MTRNYDEFSEECPDRVLVIVRGGGAKMISVCGHVLPELIDDVDVSGCDWMDVPDGLFIVEVRIEDSKSWGDFGWEYDTYWDPVSWVPITDDMWARYVADEHVWPEEYYCEMESSLATCMRRACVDTRRGLCCSRSSTSPDIAIGDSVHFVDHPLDVGWVHAKLSGGGWSVMYDEGSANWDPNVLVVLPRPSLNAYCGERGLVGSGASDDLA